MITLFVFDPKKDRNIQEKTMNCIPVTCGFFSEVFFVSDYRHINIQSKKNPWYAVLAAGEMIDEKLVEALPIYFQFSTFDFLCLYKYLGDRMEYTPRIFRSYVLLENLFNPVDVGNLIYERVLDGWLIDGI